MDAKDLVIWIIVIIGLMFVWSQYLSPDSYNYFERNFLNSQQEKTTQANLIPIECPEDIIPESINMDNRVMQPKEIIANTANTKNYPETVTQNSIFSWKDGEKGDMHSAEGSLCHKGKLEGENINLIYCEQLPYHKITTPISEEGIIGESEELHLSINLVLEEIDVKVVNTMLYGDVPVSTNKVISSECFQYT